MAENPEPLNEGELMRTCGQLYPSFAFESLSSILLVIFFSYVLLVLQSAGSLKSPGKAVCRWLASGIASYFSTFWAFASVWSTVRSMPLTARLRWCRKCNTFVCSFTIITALVSITRMLHIGNINGFRYFGYAVTCPIMMVELVVLIGPVVPLYHFTVVFTWAMTFLCLVTGYMASLQKGLVWEGDLFDFDLGSQTLKFWFTLASMALFAVIMLILPYLALLYHCGKCRFESTWLPWQYTRLLGIVAATWVLFPAWWFVSYEGMNILTDTRLNALGFAVLNMTSKGLFTWQMLCIARHEKQKAETAHEQALPASDNTDKASEVLSGTSTNSTYLWLMGSQVATEQSLMVTILKPFDTSCTFEAAKSKVPHSQRYRRNSRDMDDIPGSFKLGEQRNDVSSPVFPVLTRKASQGSPRRSSMEKNWNPSLSSLTENQNAPSGQSFQYQILEQLTVFNARLAALEQGGGKQMSEELVARKRPWGGLVSNQPGSPRQAKTELSQNPKQYIELSQGVADERHLGERVPGDPLSLSERPTFSSETSEPEWEIRARVPEDRPSFSSETPLFSERPTFSSEPSEPEQQRQAFEGERPTFEREQEKLMCGETVSGGRPSFCYSSNRPTFDKESEPEEFLWGVDTHQLSRQEIKQTLLAEGFDVAI